MPSHTHTQRGGTHLDKLDLTLLTGAICIYCFYSRAVPLTNFLLCTIRWTLSLSLSLFLCSISRSRSRSRSLFVLVLLSLSLSPLSLSFSLLYFSVSLSILFFYSLSPLFLYFLISFKMSEQKKWEGSQFQMTGRFDSFPNYWLSN